MLCPGVRAGLLTNRVGVVIPAVDWLFLVPCLGDILTCGLSALDTQLEALGVG